MKIGDVVETAIWLTGDEPEEMKRRYIDDVCAVIEKQCHSEHVMHGPITFTEKRPGEYRVPPVPDHIQGQRVRLFVAETTIMSVIETKEGSFVAQLDHVDLIRLRRYTRRQARRPMTDQECDQIIEQYGPEAALDTLRRATRH